MILTNPVAYTLNSGKVVTIYRATAENEQVVVPVRSKKLFTFIFDASGSMYSAMAELRKFAKKWMRDLEAGDAVQFIWFSSHRKYKEFLQPTGIPAGKEEAFFAKRDEIIDRELIDRDFTGFISPLEHVANVTMPYIEDNSDIFADMQHIVIFASDGGNNDGASNAEILKFIETHFTKNIQQFITVGFGNWADTKFLKQMKNASGCGTYIFARDAMEMDPHVISLIKEQSISKANVMPNKFLGAEKLLIVSDGKVIVSNPNSVNVSFLADTALIVAVHDFALAGATVLTKKNKELMMALYSLSANYIESGEKVKAMQIVDLDLKDYLFADLCQIAGTKEQYARVTAALTKAAFDETTRFVEGKKAYSGSTRPTQVELLQWCDAKGIQIPTDYPENYKAIGLSALYPKEGQVINVNGVDKTIPVTSDVADTYNKFKLDDFTFETNNVNTKVGWRKRVELRPEHQVMFAGATAVTGIPFTRAFCIINSIGENAFPTLTVVIPNRETLQEGIEKGIFAKNAVNLIQRIKLSNFPVGKMDYNAKPLDSKRFAELVLGINVVKMKISALNAAKKALETPKQGKIKLVINDQELEITPNEAQLALLKDEYFVQCSSNGLFSYTPPFKYTEDGAWTTTGAGKPGVKVLPTSHTDYNDYNEFNFGVKKVDGKAVGFNSGDKNSAVTAFKESYFNAFIANVTETPAIRYSVLKDHITKLEVEQSAMLAELAMNFKLPMTFQKLEFSGKLLPAEFDITTELGTFKVSAEVVETRDYVGYFKA